ncbi:unnamed protein product, partial [Discosporangium mesarthrocarpum]
LSNGESNGDQKPRSWEPSSEPPERTDGSSNSEVAKQVDIPTSAPQESFIEGEDTAGIQQRVGSDNQAGEEWGSPEVVHNDRTGNTAPNKEALVAALNEAERATQAEGAGQGGLDSVKDLGPGLGPVPGQALEVVRPQQGENLVEYVLGIGGEILDQIMRDLNFVMGLLPAPVSRPIKGAMDFALDIVGRITRPVLTSAERCTRGLRHGVQDTAKRALGSVRDDLCPNVIGKAGDMLQSLGRRLSEAGNAMGRD